MGGQAEEHRTDLLLQLSGGVDMALEDRLLELHWDHNDARIHHLLDIYATEPKRFRCTVAFTVPAIKDTDPRWQAGLAIVEATADVGLINGEQEAWLVHF